MSMVSNPGVSKFPHTPPLRAGRGARMVALSTIMDHQLWPCQLLDFFAAEVLERQELEKEEIPSRRRLATYLNLWRQVWPLSTKHARFPHCLSCPDGPSCSPVSLPLH